MTHYSADEMLHIVQHDTVFDVNNERIVDYGDGNNGG
jgi:hypothetical protein